MARTARLCLLVLLMVVVVAALAAAAGAATTDGSGVVVLAKPSPTPTPTAPATLATLVTDATPWLHLEANSLQRSPLYLGSTPRELALGLTPADGGVAKLPATLKTLGELQLKGIRQSLIAKKTITSKQTLTVEAWPIRDDRGRLTWCFARWRVAASDPWRWLSPADIQNTDPNTFVPETLDPSLPADYTDIFGASDDYGWNVEPAFSNCIWVERAADPALARCWEAWLPSAQRAAYSQRTDLASRLALVVPPPARLNGGALTYTVAATDAKTTWPSAIVWTAAPATPGPAAGSAVITSWPAGFDAAYRADLLAMDGEAPAVFPISGRSVTFTNKNNALAGQPARRRLQLPRRALRAARAGHLAPVVHLARDAADEPRRRHPGHELQAGAAPPCRPRRHRPRRGPRPQEHLPGRSRRRRQRFGDRRPACRRPPCSRTGSPSARSGSSTSRARSSRPTTSARGRW